MRDKIKTTKILSKPWFKGGLLGFIFGVLLAAVSAFELFNGTELEIVPQFLGSLPAVIILYLLPEALEVFIPVIYLSYWFALGGLIGWCFGKGKTGKVVVIILLLIITFAHYKANIVLQKKFDSALEAFVEFFRMFGGPLPTAK